MENPTAFFFLLGAAVDWTTAPTIMLESNNNGWVRVWPVQIDRTADCCSKYLHISEELTGCSMFQPSDLCTPTLQ